MPIIDIKESINQTSKFFSKNPTLGVMADFLEGVVQAAVQHQTYVKLGKVTVTVTVNVQEIWYVEKIIV